MLLLKPMKLSVRFLMAPQKELCIEHVVYVTPWMRAYMYRLIRRTEIYDPRPQDLETAQHFRLIEALAVQIYMAR